MSSNPKHGGALSTASAVEDGNCLSVLGSTLPIMALIELAQSKRRLMPWKMCLVDDRRGRLRAHAQHLPLSLELLAFVRLELLRAGVDQCLHNLHLAYKTAQWAQMSRTWLKQASCA